MDKCPVFVVHKIFQIGFNKCATTSLYLFFKKNGVSSVHWKIRIDKGYGDLIANRVESNVLSGRKMFSGLDYEFYSDMEAVHANRIYRAYEDFRFIDNQYPGSYFLFNTRNVEDWMKSRFRHADGAYADRCRRFFGVKDQELRQIWRQEYILHTSNVERYFRDKEKRKRFLKFDIDKDEPSKIMDFFSQINFKFEDFPHAKKTSVK